MALVFLVFFAYLELVRASYLHPQRFAFGGAYYTNPGTLNNFVNNWDPSKPIIPWWGPEGLNFFRFENATVTSVAGELDESLSSDCLFGAQVTTSTDSKIVDVDPDHQFTSEIYALQLQIVLASGFTIAGQLRVSQLDSVFFKSETGIEHENPLLGNRTSEMTGSWQSLIEDLQWDSAPPSCSPLLNALYATSQASFSIKFTTDMYDNRIGAATKGYGRLVGVIGPYIQGEPTSFSPRRLMAPLEGQAFKQNSSHIPFVVLDSTLLVDLGSSIKTKTYGGPSIFDQAILFFQTPNSTLVPLKNGIVNVSNVNSDGKGGIIPIQLLGDEPSWISGHPLLIFSYVNGSKDVLICAEHSQGLVVSTDTRAARLDMDDISIAVRAFQWGVPVSLPIPITYGKSPMPPAPGRINNVPRDGCLFEPLIQSGSNGIATLTIRPNLNDAKLPVYRQKMDSQAYFLVLPYSACMITVVVFNQHPIRTNVTWNDVYPFLDLYARLFPSMAEIMNISDQGVFDSNADIIQQVLLQSGFSQSNHMPVTRDLSYYRREMIFAYIKTLPSRGKKMRLRSPPGSEEQMSSFDKFDNRRFRRGD